MPTEPLTDELWQLRWQEALAAAEACLDTTVSDVVVCDERGIWHRWHDDLDGTGEKGDADAD